MPVDLKNLDSPMSTRMGYLERWKQALGITNLKAYSPKLYNAMSFILPLALIPVAAKVGEKVYKEVKKRYKK